MGHPRRSAVHCCNLFCKTLSSYTSAMSLRILAVVLVLAASGHSATAQSTLVGVLEDVPPWFEGGTNHRAVRVAFEKNGSEWRAFPNDCRDPECLATVSSKYPHETVWTIGFDGQKLGQVFSITPSGFGYYSGIGLQTITSQEPVPTVGERSTEFGGYTDASVYRPLVANSQSFVTDPDLWKPLHLRPELISLLRQQFRHHFGKLCRFDTNQQVLKPLSYRDEDIKEVKSYMSKSGWAIARLHLGGAIDCQDTEAGFEIDDSWFVAEPNNSVHYLDSGLWLVDAGDYDNDGHSELVFSINRDDRGGYELFYDDFKKRVIFEFSYH